MQRARSLARRLIPYVAVGAGSIALLLIALRTPILALAPLRVLAFSHGLLLDRALVALGVEGGSLELWLIGIYGVLSVPLIVLAETLPRFSSTRRWRKALATWWSLFGLLTVLALILGALGVVVD